MSTYAERLAIARTSMDKAGRRTLPPWLDDQYRAANVEAAAAMDDLTPRALQLARLIGRGREMRATTYVPNVEIAARWLAAVVDPVSCWHVRKSKGPMLAYLNLNLMRIDCSKCIRTTRQPIVDDRCEICGTTGHTDFREAVVQLGHLVILANVGACCYDMLPATEGAA